METQEKEEGHADQVQGRLDVCLEQIEMLRAELVGTAPNDPHAKAGVTMTKIVRRSPARGSERRRFDSVRGRGANMCDARRGHRVAQWWSEMSGHRASELPLWS